MRCFELVKKEDTRSGKIMMCIEGYPCELSSVIAKLSDTYKACNYEEGGKNDGEIALFFVISRTFKKDFMADYKQAKKNIS